MIKITVLSLILASFSLFAQDMPHFLQHYPPEQEAYKGGEIQFYKDFHEILIDKKLQPCENKNEIYYLKVIVNEDSSVKYVQDDFNAEMAAQNKCTYQLGLDVLKYMNKWKPAVIDGKQRPAIAGYQIVPNDLFDNYKEGYTVETIPAYFNGAADGFSKFRSEVVKKINVNGFGWRESFKMIINFSVNREGLIEDVKLEKPSGLPEFDSRVINSIKSIKKKWSPATISGIPVKYRLRLPLSFGNPS